MTSIDVYVKPSIGKYRYVVLRWKDNKNDTGDSDVIGEVKLHRQSTDDEFIYYYKLTDLFANHDYLIQAQTISENGEVDGPVKEHVYKTGLLLLFIKVTDKNATNDGYDGFCHRVD